MWKRTYQLPPIRFPCADLLAADRQVDGVDLNAIPCVVARLLLLEEALVDLAVGGFMQPRRESEIGEFQVSVLVYEDVIGLDITVYGEGTKQDGLNKVHAPMYVSEIVHGLDSQYTLCHIKSCHVFREHVVFH